MRYRVTGRGKYAWMALQEWVHMKHVKMDVKHMLHYSRRVLFESYTLRSLVSVLEGVNAAVFIKIRIEQIRLTGYL